MRSYTVPLAPIFPSDPDFESEKNRRFQAGFSYDGEDKRNVVTGTADELQSLALMYRNCIDESMLEKKNNINVFFQEKPTGTMTLAKQMILYYMEILSLSNLDKKYPGNENIRKKFGIDRVLLQHVKDGKVPFVCEPEKAIEKPKWEKKDGYRQTVPVMVLLGGKGRREKEIYFAIPAGAEISGDALENENRNKFISLSPMTGCPPLIINENHLCGDAGSRRTPCFGYVTPDNNVLPKPGTEYSTWHDLWAGIRETLRAFSHGKISGGLDEKEISGHIKFAGIIPFGMASYDQNLKKLYNFILSSSKEPVPIEKLFSALTKPDNKKSYGWNDQESSGLRKAQTGHIGATYGLDMSQRHSLWQMFRDGRNALNAVTGPPGTGKTTMLQSLIASLSVTGAIRTKPFLIIAASQNNQATTNIINAFGSIASEWDEKNPSCESRWIDGIPSYGWYMPSASAKRNSAKFQILSRDSKYLQLYGADGTASGFANPVHPDPDILREIRDEYLAKFNLWAKHSGPADGIPCLGTVHAVSDYLHSRICSLAGPGGSMPQIVDLSLVFMEQRKKLPISMEQIGKAAARWEKFKCRENLFPSETHDHMRLEAEKSENLEHVRTLRNFIGSTDSLDLRVSSKDRIYRLLRMLSAPFRYLESLARGRASMHNAWLILRKFNPDAPYGAQAVSDGCRNLCNTLLDANRNIDILIRMEKEKNEKIRLEKLAFARRKDKLSAKYNLCSSVFEQWESLVGSLRKCIREACGRESSDSFLTALAVRPPAAMHGETKDFAVKGSTIRELADLCVQNEKFSHEFMQEIESLLDVTVRRKAFHLSMRYWESRWIHDSTSSPVNVFGPPSPALRRAAMLAPVIVSTLQTLPNLSFCMEGAEFEIADWLIIDEAGQVPVQNAVPSFALASNILVIGDVHQLKPIQNMTMSDNLLIRHHHLTHAIRSNPCFDAFDAYYGNIMQASLFSASFHDNCDKLDGTTLKYHYRCRETIIGFCNELIYGKTCRLVPMVTNAPPAQEGRTVAGLSDKIALFPPMAFAAVCGSEEKYSDSRSNPAEAREITEWIIGNKSRIEECYRRPIEEVIAVITPFRSQKTALCNMLAGAGIRTREKSDASSSESKAETGSVALMVIGTVHALQGAERPIVIFSPVSTEKNGFIDRNKDMLNVAVSRAKHSFLLFGHEKLFFDDIKGDEPSAVLGRYMLSHGRRLYPRNLVLIESKGKVPFFAEAMKNQCSVYATEGHIREMNITENHDISWYLTEKGNRFLNEYRKFTKYGPQHYDKIILATDDDAEGETIAWHIIDTILKHFSGTSKDIFFRMRYSFMNADHILESYHHLSYGIDAVRVRSAVTRKIADFMINRVISNATNGEIPWASRTTAAAMHAVRSLEENGRKLCKYVDATDSSGNKTRFFKTKNDRYFGPAEKFAPGETNPEIPEKSTVIISDGALRKAEPPLRTVSTAWIMILAQQVCGIPASETVDALENIYLTPPSK